MNRREPIIHLPAVNTLSRAVDVRWGLDFNGEQVVQLSPDVNLKRGVNLQPLREWHERDPIFALLGLTSLSPVDFVFEDVVKMKMMNGTYSFSRLLKHICPLWHHIFKTVNTQDKTEAQWPKWLILLAKCSNTHKTLKTCNISKYFHQTPQLVVKLIYSFNQSLHDGQQNTAINMKYDTLQTQMDTGKKKSYQRKLMGGNTFKNIYILSFTFSPFVLDDYATGSHQHRIECFPLQCTEGNTSLHGVSIPGSPLHLLPGNQHSLPPGGASAHMAGDHTPSTSKQRRTPRLVQKRRVCREELHHNTRLCCKPFIHKARVVESNIVPNYDIQTHARPQQPSLFGWNQYFFQCIKKCDEAFCIVWANSWYVAKDPIIGDGSTHGDIGTPLTWHCDSGPLPNDVPPASPHFTEVEAGFIHKNEFVMCPFSFKLHYSLRKRAN